MKILFTGGVTGGHFYPIIAIAKEIQKISKEEHALPPKLYFMAPGPYDSRLLFENEIEFIGTPAGKMRRYFSFANFFDIFKTTFGVLRAIISVFYIFPDVIVGKGGYGSFPALLAAKLFRIPVVIHESDTIPGRVNAWAGKFATRVATSYPETAKLFEVNKTAWTGQPVRKEVTMPIKDGAYEFLKLEKEIPIILILGGSQGAQKLNDVVLNLIPKLLLKYQVIHQTGEKNYKEILNTASVVLEKNEHATRYRPFPYLNELALRMSAGVSSVVVTRAGSTLFEIASWGLPAIVVPIGEDVSHDQTQNAFAYARSGAASVIEEKNLTSSILNFEIEKILNNQQLQENMKKSALGFAKPDATRKIAKAIFEIAIKHEM
ncbi:MAG: UDP-N-acetylglucosamine--N-acetylmuramyl-(pentapeptide) pyrophosphoryl-undecaprenol N-acetylglucosamine transferase [Patescibacteria group bacterium]